MRQFIEVVESREPDGHAFAREPCFTVKSIQANESASFLADTVFALNRKIRSGRVHRSIEVVKSRGQDYDAGEHTLKIDSGAGLTGVPPGAGSPPRGNLAQPTSTAQRSVIGVEALDSFIGGGIFDGSTTMVVGVSGVGKTVLGTQLLLEGAQQQGRRGLLVSLDEHPAQILRNAETIGLNLETDRSGPYPDSV